MRRGISGGLLVGSGLGFRAAAIARPAESERMGPSALRCFDITSAN